MIPNDFDTSHRDVVRLVKTFADSHDKYLAPSYNESAARKDAKRFPIHSINLSDSDEKTKHDPIVRSVEEIMKAKAKLTEAGNNSDVKFWTNKCEKLESDINTAVYSLYALTADEIKLIENS